MAERAREREPAGAATPSRWSDQQVEQMIGNLLRTGVLLAAGVTALGGVALLIQHGWELADYRVFRSEPSELRSIGGIVSGALRLESRAVVQLGVVLLLATPVARVLFTFVAFVLQRDRLYVGITAIVLGILLFSVLLGGAA
jgi:uncharacterized membrane protein